MEPATPVTHPAPGAYRLGAATYTLVDGLNPGNLIVRRSRRVVAVLYPNGELVGPGRDAAAAILAGHAQRVYRCGDCHRELTDAESIARGVGPDCWAARERSA